MSKKWFTVAEHPARHELDARCLWGNNTEPTVAPADTDVEEVEEPEEEGRSVGTASGSARRHHAAAGRLVKLGREKTVSSNRSSTTSTQAELTFRPT
jgi:hypothetical protein